MKKRNNKVYDFDSYIFEQTGLHINELDCKSEYEYHHPILDSVAKYILNAIRNNRKIWIVGDYDADGLMSICILSCLMKKIGADYSITIPKRFSEGYGLSEKIIERLPDNCLLVTVDNGITAIDQIAKAKARGIDTIILDHHKSDSYEEDKKDKKLPDAVIIADPKVILQKNDFTFFDYCGAGLAYKLSFQMFRDDKEFIDEMSAFAAVATIADVMPLIGDNRNIVKRGLNIINEGKSTYGMNILAKTMYSGVYESADVAFKLAPAINAPGRLEDDGGKEIVKCMLLNSEKVLEIAENIKKINEKRRELTEKALEAVKPVGNNISFAYASSEDIPEGLCGLIAGKLAEQTKRPSFVVTDTENIGENIIKGSVRAAGNENLFEIMSKVNNKGLFLSFGGHVSAAGFSFKKENLDQVISSLDEAAKDIKVLDNMETYDFDVLFNDISDAYKTFCSIKPFGEGLANPLIKVEVQAENFAYVGKDNNTLQITTPSIKLVGFNMSQEYKGLNEPKKFTVYGRFATNYFNGNEYPQIIMEKIEE